MKFFNASYHIFVWCGSTAFVLGMAALIAWVVGIDYQTALGVTMVALLVDIQMEVDGIARTRRYIERQIKKAVEDKTNATEKELLNK